MTVESITQPEVRTEPCAARPADVVKARPSVRRRLRRGIYHAAIRTMMFGYTLTLALARTLRRPPGRVAAGQKQTILLTGRFEADNWARAHLQPLAAAKNCERLFVVSTYPVPEMPNVTPIYPSRWMIKWFGATQARLLVFCAWAIRHRPHVIGGFHLLVNGLASILLARAIRTRSMYFCVGGPVEALDGGIRGEPGPFASMETRDAYVEKCLLNALRNCQLIITMGTRAKEFFRERDVMSECHVVAGGIDGARFSTPSSGRDIDIVFVGRLAEIKQVDILLRAIAILRSQRTIRAAIVGDGPLRGSLESLASELGISADVRFTGRQADVAAWLRRSKVFVLTSRSEGLSLALMEAMTCGVPAVVPDVGDLGDLVRHGCNGFLASDHRPETFAGYLEELLSDEDRLRSSSRAALESMKPYAPADVARRWDAILAGEAES